MEQKAKPARLESLDVFRGITIAGMILVNNPGSWSYIYPALGHAEWHGWTPTDYIFPFFLFIVGVSLTLSFKNRLDRGANHHSLMIHTIRRGLIIFALGFFLSLFPKFDFSTVRVMGVLNRIAIVYVCASFMYLYLKPRTQLIVSIAILFLYWAAMALIPVPGYGANDLSKMGNLAGYLDRMILGNHVWSGSRDWGDPEGILSTFPAIVTTMSGIFTGMWLQKNKEKYETVSGMFFMGLILFVLGLVWDMWFPINKNIWTSSYVLVMAGLALLFLGFCYYLIDIKGKKSYGFPFKVFGMNAIASFFLSSFVAKSLAVFKLTVTGIDGKEMEISYKQLIFDNVYSGLTWSPYLDSLAYALSYLLLWYIIMYIFYKKNWFIKV